MAGFRKAKAEQAALKLGIYGPQGSGKTFTSLLIAEGLANLTKKRVAYVDTEHGTDFYCKTVPARAFHPDGFDFDALYTKSITEVLAAVKGLNCDEYGVLIIDSMTHIWESARAAYSGRVTKVGSIPFHAWASIKKPYKEIITILLNSPLHVIFCGRQGVEYETDEETDELKAVGLKMKAEGETPYEPHILIRLEAIKPKKTNEVAQIIAYAEKDRTGILAGRSIVNPNFENMIAPLMSLMGETQAQIAGEDETAAKDAEALAQADAEREKESAEILRTFTARIALTDDLLSLKEIGKEITPKLKARMVPAQLAELREKYTERQTELERGPKKKDEPNDE